MFLRKEVSQDFREKELGLLRGWDDRIVRLASIITAIQNQGLYSCTCNALIIFDEAQGMFYQFLRSSDQSIRNRGCN